GFIEKYVYGISKYFATFSTFLCLILFDAIQIFIPLCFIWFIHSLIPSSGSLSSVIKVLSESNISAFMLLSFSISTVISVIFLICIFGLKSIFISFYFFLHGYYIYKK